MKKIFFLTLLLICIAHIASYAQEQMLYKTVDTTQLYLTVYPSAIKVPDNKSNAPIILTFISFAALFVKVIAKMFAKVEFLVSSNNNERYFKTKLYVFPLPADAFNTINDLLSFSII